jgi:hypothetical protein
LSKEDGITNEVREMSKVDLEGRAYAVFLKLTESMVSLTPSQMGDIVEF